MDTLVSILANQIARERRHLDKIKAGLAAPGRSAEPSPLAGVDESLALLG